jgi:nucleotide-binding universal stress UspA family protein
MIAIRNILVATDFSDSSATALNYGRELARRFGAVLHVLHVVDDIAARVSLASGLPYDLGQAQTELETTAHQQLLACLDEEDRRELNIELVQRTSTSPAYAISTYAREADIDLIIAGTHGRGTVAHLFMGSVAERVIRTAPCPVLTVRHPEHEFIRPDALTTVAHA